MDKVIAVLERQIRLEEAAIFHNKVERDSAKSLPGYKGPGLYTEHPEYIDELKKAVAILKTPSPIQEPVDQQEQGFLWQEVHEALNKLRELVAGGYDEEAKAHELNFKSKYIIKRRVE